MRVKVRYFGALRDQRGVSQEVLDSDIPTPAALFGMLQTQHGLTLKQSQIRFAVNGQYVESDHELKDGDEVVFIPPVAGG